MRLWQDKKQTGARGETVLKIYCYNFAGKQVLARKMAPCYFHDLLTCIMSLSVVFSHFTILPFYHFLLSFEDGDEQGQKCCPELNESRTDCRNGRLND